MFEKIIKQLKIDSKKIKISDDVNTFKESEKKKEDSLKK